MFLPGLLTQSILYGTGIFSLLIFYQMLNKRSKQHSLLHFLIGKLDQTGLPHPLFQFDILDMLCEKVHEKKTCSVESLIYF